MRKRDKTCAKATPEEPKREQRMVCLMSEEELRIVDRYLEKYKITNKSRRRCYAWWQISERMYSLRDR